MNDIKQQLLNLQDKEYQKFHSKLVPTINPDRIIGIRVPVLRAYSKRLFASGDYKEFLNVLPHYYLEENNLHAFLIEQIKDFDLCVSYLQKFLPFIDNWATCDSLRPKCFAKNLSKLLPLIDEWLSSDNTYVLRFGIEMLMNFFLDKHFNSAYLEKVASVKSDEYYVNMMIAWYFATALSKQKTSVLPYFENKQLPVWVHNKAIQKAVESYRISPNDKIYLKSLKIK